MSYAAASRRHERQHHHHAQQQRVHYEAAPVTRRSTDGPTEVHIEGVALLKIIKHCRDNFPLVVAGALLGMDHLSGEQAGVVEVTNCFPQPPNADDGQRDGDEPYEMRMMKAMREVGADYNDVGWYTSTYLGTYFLKDTIEHQAEFQAVAPNAVMIVYDNVPTANGNLSIKAVRLTNEFMEQWKTHGSHKLSQEAFAKLVPSAVFEELRVCIHNPHLINLFLIDTAESKALARSVPAVGASAASERASAVSTRAGGVASSGTHQGSSSAHTPAELDSDLARLDLNTAPYLEKHLEFLNDVTETLLKQQNDAAYALRRQQQAARQREEWIARRRAENEARAAAGLDLLPEEDHSLHFFREQQQKRRDGDNLDSLLISAQIGTYCEQVNKFAGASAGKLFLAGQMQKLA